MAAGRRSHGGRTSVRHGGACIHHGAGQEGSLPRAGRRHRGGGRDGCASRACFGGGSLSFPAPPAASFAHNVPRGVGSCAIHRPSHVTDICAPFPPLSRRFLPSLTPTLPQALLMPLRTIMNSQYRHGKSLQDVGQRLWSEGGLRRFYRCVRS